jgi:C-terminal processing protease CtpA/Prc
MHSGKQILQLLAIFLISGVMCAQEAPPAPPATPAVPAPAPRAAQHARTVIVRNGSGNGYLGVSVRDISSDDVSSLKLPDESGVEITVVDQDSPAGKAGLKEHDVIRTFNGEKVESRAQLFRMLTETPAGHTVTLGLLRNGQPLNMKVQLADRHVYTSGPIVIPRIEVPEINIPAMNIDMGNMEMLMSTARSGIQVESLTPQLREFFGSPSDQGLLVRSVQKGSPADQAGLRAGDVIVKVGDRQIRSVGDYRMALRDSSGKSVSVGIVRDKREQSLTMKLPERRESSSALEDFDIQLNGLDEGLAGLDAMLAMLDAQKEQWKAWQKSFQDSQKEWQKQMKDWQKDWEKDKDKDKDKEWKYHDFE